MNPMLAVSALMAIVVALAACSDGSQIDAESNVQSTPCGAKGQPCCSDEASLCGDGLMCVDWECVDPCGGEGQPCCNQVACYAGFACAAGICQCGGPSQPCCEIPCNDGASACGYTCTGELTCGVDGCVECGGLGQPCCDGACNDGMACDYDTCAYGQAELYVYFCPDYAASGCTLPSNFILNGTCSPIASGEPQLGEWIPTGLSIDPARVYSLSACKAGNQPGTCGGCTAPKTIPKAGQFQSAVVCAPPFTCNGSACTPPPCPGQAI